jgi:hypothetical protein
MRCSVLGAVALTSIADAKGAGQFQPLPLSGVQVPKIVTSSEDPFKLAGTPDLPVDLPDAKEAAKRAENVVQGMTEAFLGESVTSSERGCLSDGTSGLASEVTGTSLQTVEKLHSLFGHVQSSFSDLSSLAKTGTSPPSQVMQMGAGGVPTFGYGSGYSPPGGYPTWARAPRSASMSTADAAMDTVELARLTSLELSNTLTNMFNLEDKITKKCLKGNALDLLNIAKDRAKNMSYVGGHVVANGPAIVDLLAGAVSTFDAHDEVAFGKNMGGAMRQVLLAKSDGPSTLQGRLQELMKDMDPETVVKELEPEAIQKATAGFVSALFGADSGFTVNLEASGSGEIQTTPNPGFGFGGANDYWDLAPKGTMRFQMPEKYRAATDDTEVQIDLQSCVAGNMDLMHEAWKPAVQLSEQFMEGHCTGAVRSLCTSLYTVVLTDVQQGLRTCGFTPEQEAILIHSMWAGDMIHEKLSMPHGEATKHDVTISMANAVENWHGARYTHWGANMGELMRDLVVESFPEKFTFDERGRIRMIIKESQATWRSSPTLFGGLAVTTCALVLLLTGLVVTRVQRARRSQVNSMRAGTLDWQLVDDPEASLATVGGPTTVDEDVGLE